MWKVACQCYVLRRKSGGIEHGAVEVEVGFLVIVVESVVWRES